MAAKHLIFYVIVLLVTFDEKLIQGFEETSPEQTRILIRNSCSSNLLLTSLQLLKVGDEYCVYFLGNIRRNVTIEFAVPCINSCSRIGLCGLVEGRMLGIPLPISEIKNKIQDPVSVFMINEKYRLEPVSIKEILNDRISLIDPIPDVDLSEILAEVPPEMLANPEELDAGLIRLRSTPMQFFFPPAAKSNPDSLVAYSIAYANGWYSSLYGNISKLSLPLSSLWRICEPYKPHDDITVPHLAPLTSDGKYDPFSKDLKIESGENTGPNQRAFENVVINGFMNGLGAGLKSLSEQKNE
ncbi:MAG: hypothetical protein KDK99_01480 [Verrucomicrobiales bacterium]|nr:hypothetical protein [Verrucomicrobiales bacterium]